MSKKHRILLIISIKSSLLISEVKFLIADNIEFILFQGKRPDDWDSV